MFWSDASVLKTYILFEWRKYLNIKFKLVEAKTYIEKNGPYWNLGWILNNSKAYLMRAPWSPEGPFCYNQI